ncbi:MAG TPA: helix-turn-helix domain-containing protein [Solirubrobacteraceae bacterium]|jgi:AcrR family transcriptional regulator
MAVQPLTPSERPLRRDAERNRQRLLASARELLTERGLDVTMDEVAHHAGVGVGTAYRRFASRDELIEALIDERLADFLALADAAAGAADPWEGLVSFVERSTAMQVADRGLKDLLTGHQLARVARLRARVNAVLGGLVARAREAGVLRPDVEEHDVGMIAFMLSSVADLAGDVRPDLWRRYLVLVLDGLRVDGAGATPLPVPVMGTEEAERALAAWRPRRR